MLFETMKRDARDWIKQNSSPSKMIGGVVVKYDVVGDIPAEILDFIVSLLQPSAGSPIETFLIADEAGNPIRPVLFPKQEDAARALRAMQAQYPTVYQDDTVQNFTLTRKQKNAA